MFLIHPLDGGVVDGVAGGSQFAATPAGHGLHAVALSNDNDAVLDAPPEKRPPETRIR
jgi:hypothetical protein